MTALSTDHPNQATQPPDRNAGPSDSASTSRAGGALLIVLAVLVVRLLWQGAFTAYVRPAMAIPLGIAAAFLAGTGIFLIVQPSLRHRDDDADSAADDGHRPEGDRVADHEQHGHRHGSFAKVAWLLALPALVLTLIAPGALGPSAAATTRAPTSMPFHTTPLNADASGVITMKLRDLTAWTTQDPRRQLLHRRIRIIGMVSSVAAGDGRELLLSRYTITCCAADATPFSAAVTLTADSPVPVKGTWLEVIGTWNGNKDPQGWPKLADAADRPINQPAEPYEL